MKINKLKKVCLNQISQIERLVSRKIVKQEEERAFVATQITTTQINNQTTQKSHKSHKMKSSHLIFVALISLVLLTRHVQAGAHDELAKKFVKLLIAAALLSPPGKQFI